MSIRPLIPAAIRALLPFALAASLALQANAQENQPARIVAIGGAVTETLFALGVEDRIVAVDTTSIYPPEAAQRPNVGYMRALSAEGVLTQSPDLVLMEEGAGPPPAIALLKSSGVRVETIPGGHGIGALARKLAAIGAAAGEPEAGQALGQEVEAGLQRLEAELAPIETRMRVLFILSIVDGRPMAAGSGTAADAIIAIAGGRNVFADAIGYKTLSAEAATKLAPDVVVMMTGAGPNHATVDPFEIPALAATPAGEAKALVRMDASYLLGFGPRTADAARDLAAQLYPGTIKPAR